MTLSTKKKIFCYYYAKLGNVKESAIKAGYTKFSGLYEGQKILNSKEGKDYISRLCDSQRCDGTSLIKRGLERLAFGSVNDAVSLLFGESEETSADTIDSLDLFNVSEIKRRKGGAVEIKFFDRQKALEALSEFLQKSDTDTAKDFFEALKSSGDNLGDNLEI